MVSASAATGPTPWLVQGDPKQAEFVIFGFHYAGTGAASTYRAWPQRIGQGWFSPLQPPGREDRIREMPLGSHPAFAADLVDALADYLDRPYAFAGHCGAVTYMVETVLRLEALGLPLPRRLFASSWGAPHRGLYGRLNTLDLDQIDIVGELQCIAVQRFGSALPIALVDIAAETLMFDLRVQREYRYGGRPRIPCPVVVIGWTRDAVVPASVTWPGGWDECSDAEFRELDGDHWEFLKCPPALRELLEQEMQA